MKNIFYAIKIKGHDCLLCGHADHIIDITRMMPAKWDGDVPFLFYSENEARNALKNDYYYLWPTGYQLEVVEIVLLTNKQLAELEIDRMLKS